MALASTPPHQAPAPARHLHGQGRQCRSRPRRDPQGHHRARQTQKPMFSLQPLRAQRNRAGHYGSRPESHPGWGRPRAAAGSLMQPGRGCASRAAAQSRARQHRRHSGNARPEVPGSLPGDFSDFAQRLGVQQQVGKHRVGGQVDGHYLPCHAVRPEGTRTLTKFASMGMPSVSVDTGSLSADGHHLRKRSGARSELQTGLVVAVDPSQQCRHPSSPSAR